jgi:hypothetical protein
MLGTSLGGALLRTRGMGIGAALAVLLVVLFGASSPRLARRVRSDSGWQLFAAVALALVAAPVEAAGGLATRAIVAGVSLRAVVFLASVFAVRAALVASAKNGAERSARFYLAAGLLALLAFAAFTRFHHASEAFGAALTAGAVLLLALRRPTAKDLKALGLYLTALAFAAALLPLLL